MRELPQDPRSFTDLLMEIDRQAPAAVAATFRPPADDAAIARIEQRLGHPMPQNLRQLLQWHDGQAWNSLLRESDNRRLLSVDEILETLSFFLDGKEDFMGPWEPHWTPVLTNDAGDYVVIDTPPTGDGALLAYWHDDENGGPEYPSLDAWAVGLVDELGNPGG